MVGGLDVYSGLLGTHADGGFTTLSLCCFHRRSQYSPQQSKREHALALKCFQQEMILYHFLSCFIGQNKSKGHGFCQSVGGGGEVWSLHVPERRGMDV